MAIHTNNVDITFDEAKIAAKITQLLDDDTMYKIQALFAETIDPWTPFLSGDLHSQLKIDATGVEYLVPYSRKKYYGQVYTKTEHPLATSHWDEVAMQSQKDVFTEKVKAILVEKAKQLYG